MAQENFFKRMINRMTLQEPAQLPAIQEKDVQTIIIKSQNLGTPGTKIFSGYLDEEYFFDLKNPVQRAKFYDEMRRSDAGLSMCINAIQNFIRSSKWRFDPFNDEPWAREDAALAEQMFFRDPATSWMQLVNESTSCIFHGFVAFEYTNKIVYNHPKFGTYVSLKDLSYRSQKTIEKWNVEKGSGKLLSITQCSYGDLDAYVDIPAEYLIVVSLNREGANYEGISMLRPCVGGYKRKKVYMKLNAIGIEKFAIPTPIAKIDNDDINSKSYQNLKTVLEDYTGHESSFIIHPQGIEIDLHSNTYDPDKVEKSIEAEDLRNARSFLVQFLMLGQSGGSFALSKDQSDFLLNGIDYIPRVFAEEINRCLVPKLIKLNRGDRPGYPILRHSGIIDQAGKELAEALLSLVNGRVVIPDDPLETDVREKFGLPKASKEGQRLVNISQQPFGQQFSDGDLDYLKPYFNDLYKRIKLAEKNRGI